MEFCYVRLGAMSLVLCYTYIYTLYLIIPPFLHDKTKVLEHASFVLQTLDFKTRPYPVSGYYRFYEMRLAVGDV